MARTTAKGFGFQIRRFTKEDQMYTNHILFNETFNSIEKAMEVCDENNERALIPAGDYYMVTTVRL